jgi:uncharacterized protein involved in exopolysaccharide biosynthesis
MEVIAIFDVLRRHVLLIAALCIVTTLAGYGISFVSPLIPEKYDATAVVLVRPRDPIKIQPINRGKEFLDFPVAQTPVVESASKTYIQIIQSPFLIGEVVHELDLDKKKPFKPANDSIFSKILVSMKELYDQIDPYVKDAIALMKYGRLLHDDPFTKAVKDIKKGLVLKAYEDTYAFEIKYSDEDPQTAADVANTLAKLFIEFMGEIRSSEARGAADRLKSELDQSRQRLVDARESFRDYKVAHGVFLYQTEYDSKLRVISDLTVELAKLDASLAKLDSSDANEKAPTSSKVNAYVEKRARLLKILDEKQAELASLPTVERELQLRQSDLDVANATYGAVAKELKDAEIKLDAMPEARLISAAFVPKVPSTPRRDLILGVSLLAGLLIGVALALFLEYINRRARRISDIEDFVGLKVIGTIPLVPRTRQPGAS